MLRKEPCPATYVSPEGANGTLGNVVLTVLNVFTVFTPFCLFTLLFLLVLLLARAATAAAPHTRPVACLDGDQLHFGVDPVLPEHYNEQYQIEHSKEGRQEAWPRVQVELQFDGIPVHTFGSKRIEGEPQTCRGALGEEH